ncbi:hypothetical protein Q427_11625 [Halomonas sp. BC04]|nr:hypothetical protein Q427_11625 [Halomonas sp. BC04]
MGAGEILGKAGVQFTAVGARRLSSWSTGIGRQKK